MVKDAFIEKEHILLVQTNSKDLEQLLLNSVKDANIRLETVTHSTGLYEQKWRGQIITFIVGSDVQDPIQSAQRLHALNKSAKIILLSEPDNLASLKKAVLFSPFIGMDVFCIDESNQSELENKVDEILQNSRRSEHYRDIITESNSVIASKVISRKSNISTNFINKLMDIAPIGITIVDQKGKILGWNKEAAAIFGKNEIQILGTPLSHLFDQVEGYKLDNYLRGSIIKSGTGQPNPLTLERELPDESKQVLSFTAEAFTYSEGTEKAMILAIKDITQNVELLNQLKTEVTARDNFLSMASHELRTPLTSLKISLELLKKTINQNFPDAPGILDLNDKSIKQTDRLNELIEDLFDVAKIHSGKLDFYLEKFNLSEFVINFVMDTQEKFKEANSDLELDIEPNVIGVWDKDRIEQAFSNLISNVLKYAPNVPVEITLSSKDKWVFLSVRDYGPGISEDKQSKIFDRFERATDSKTISGLGLGLFITKKIVEGHSGSIQIQSAPGKGSAFTIKLPLKPDPEQQSGSPGIVW